MSKPIDPIGVNPTAYDYINAAQAGQSSGSEISNVLNGAIEEQIRQSLMPNMGGLGGPGAIPGVYMPSSTAGMENALLATAENGEMSGAHLMLFMMIMMMQTSDSGGELAPIIQMVMQKLSESGGNTSGDIINPLSIPLGTKQNDVLDSLDTDPKIRRMVDIALSQVGTREKNKDGSYGSGNYTDYGAWYGMDGQPWCAMFVSWAADQAGILNTSVPKHASTAKGVSAYKEKGLYAPQNTDYIPKEGDAIYFSSSAGRIKHVGIVIAYDPASNKVYTVEGNTNNAVRIRHYDINDSRIHGYGKNGGTSYGTIPGSSTSGVGANTV